MTRLILFTALVLCVSISPHHSQGADFAPLPLQIADYGLFDLGIVDANSDGRLDIYTANHSGVQSVLLNDGTGKFKDTYSDWKMDQDTQFPGLAIYPLEPSPDRPGIYVNWVGPDVVVRFHEVNTTNPIQGSIDVLTSVKMISMQDITVDVDSKKESPELDSSKITFSGKGNGHFSFRPYNHALPFRFKFNESIDSKSIYVGQQKASPSSRDFVFQLRDRHGMAWADVNGDQKMDVFITRGGERDTMSKMPITFWDELLVGTTGCMEDTGKASGLDKKGCPGRQAAWVDFNRDSMLDLYVVCGRGDGPHPNMLFKQISPGRFEDVAASVGLAIESNGPFVWLDADRDGDMDLFWVDPSGVYFYRNEKGAFLPAKIETQRPKHSGFKLAVADYDNDGDLDVFLAAHPNSCLFVNTAGNFSELALQPLGLPDKCFTANWIDYDNDGLMDLHTLPDGLYLQTQQGKFVHESKLEIAQSKYSPYRMDGARASWFDMDNDGSRDVVFATEWGKKKSRLWNLYFKIFDEDRRFGGMDTFWQTTLLKNVKNDNHWLQMELTGPNGNLQAIGAFVTLRTSSGTQGQQVGCADGAHSGQGHYRLYFGLGKQSEILSLRIDWPDGSFNEIDRPAIDRMLKISYSNTTKTS